jgi:class 3 adenylate cyclase
VLSKPTIVAVDDEPIVLDSISEQLERWFRDAYDVEVAQDAGEALELVAQLTDEGTDVPVVISDHIMPGMKGDEFLIQLHKLLPRTRKILLTGQAGIGAVTNIVNEGALYRYIGKPWDHQDLVLTVREAARSYLRELQVERQRAVLLATHAVTQRFVPHEFLKLLGREHLVDISRTDHLELEMSILFTDIRKYTTLVEGYSGAQNFAFINDYLTFLEPPIISHGGFVDHYAGDGVLALFAGTADDAVRAGIESYAALDRYNAVRSAQGQAPIDIGAGVNTGTLMLGIIGGSARLSAGVIGDPVNLASRLESLTKHRGARFLISGETRDRLDDPGAYALRYIDRVRVKGRVAPVKVYEVLDAQPEPIRGSRLATREGFARGREAFEAADIAGALAAFEAAARLDPTDPVLTLHVERCRAFINDGVPDAWDGVVELTRK